MERDARNTFFVNSIRHQQALSARVPLTTTLSSAVPCGQEMEQPLDLRVSSRPGERSSCSDCKELRREVREVKNSVQFLIQQFSEFTGRWADALVCSNSCASKRKSLEDRQRSSPGSSVSSVESCHNSSKESRKRGFSPESASSSLDSSVSVQVKNCKSLATLATKSKKTKSFAPDVYSEPVLPSPKVVDALEPLGIPETKPAKLEPSHQSPQPIPTYPNPNWHLQQLWNPLLNQTRETAVDRHRSSSAKTSGGRLNGMGSPSPPGSGNGIPSPSASGLTQAQLLDAAVKAMVNIQAQKAHARKYLRNSAMLENNSPEDIPATASDISSMFPHQKTNSQELDDLLDNSSGPSKKRPGPDDFVKEFVEQEEGTGGSQEERKLQIPVPEALECDPNFRPVSEEALLCSTRWQELDWQEAVTRLSKKLAEKRVFGPLLMARATVAGTNHSNYPNLPIQGIMYIESTDTDALFQHF